jgi:hypothetical protein
MKSAWYFVIPCVLLLACEQTHYPDEIRRLDSLRVELDSAELLHRRIDTTGFAEAGRKFTENLGFIQQTYTDGNDTIPRDVALLMADYRDLKKPSQGFLTSYERAREELRFSKDQIRDLKHDLENNLLDSGLVEEMVNEELQAVSELTAAIEQLKVSSEYTREKRKALEPRIDSLITALKKKTP